MFSTHPFLAIDLGGSHTRLGLFTSPDTPLFTQLDSFPTPTIYTDMLEHVSALLKEHSLKQLAGAGVSVAARVARDGRCLVFGPNLPDYLQQPLAADLEERLGHDAVAVSGAIALENNFLIPMLQHYLAEQLHGSTLALLKAELGAHAPLVGAVSLLAVPEQTFLH